MKKLLSLLGAIGLVTSSVISTTACVPDTNVEEPIFPPDELIPWTPIAPPDESIPWTPIDPPEIIFPGFPSFPETVEEAQKEILIYSELLSKDEQEMYKLGWGSFESNQYMIDSDYSVNWYIINTFIGEIYEMSSNDEECEIWIYDPEKDEIVITTIPVQISRNENFTQLETYLFALKNGEVEFQEGITGIEEYINKIESVYNWILASLKMQSFSSLFEEKNLGEIVGKEQDKEQLILDRLIEKNPLLSDYKDELEISEYSSDAIKVNPIENYIGDVICNFTFIVEE